MTQQFDLTFNTTNTMDKMMTQTQTKSYSNSSYTNADQFDNFLTSANKSYTQENNSFNNNKTQSKVDYKKDSKSDNKSTNVSENKADYKETTKYEDNSSNTVVEEKSTQHEEKVSSSKNENIANEKLEEVKDLVVSDDVIANNTEVDVKEMILVSNAQMSNLEMTKNDVAKDDKNLLMADISVDDEIPAEAIKSGINLETLTKAVETTVEDTTGVNMQVVEDAVKDTKVSKEDAISALYNAGNSKNDDLKETKDDNVAVDKLSKANVNGEIKVKDNDEISSLKNLDETKVEDVKVELNENKNAEVENTTIDLKTATEKDLNKDESTKITDNAKEIVKDESLNTQDLDKLKVVEDIKTEKDDIRATIEDKEFVQALNSAESEVVQNVDAINLSEASQTAVQNKETLTPTEKMNTLQDELQSAKAENAYETLSSQNEKSVKTENKTDDKFAKTNVQAEETMEIKDDTKGIEFVSQKQDKVVDKNDLQDKNVANLKEKVENVKIQVEDNVKVATNNQVQDSAKVEKANETMNRAGLSTQTLREMDGKITAMETGNQAGAQFGETSQEMLMRDMLSQSATTQTTDAKTTVDFSQAMNKTTMAQQPQAQQTTQDAQEVNILDQIRAKFAVSKQNGLQKLTIGLTPESLGKVTVEIVKGQNGISAHLLADNPQAKEILDKNLDGLKSVLQSQGVNVNNVNVKVAEAGRSSDSNNNMFQNEDGQFNQGSSGEHSREGNSSNQERHSEYEFVQNNAMHTENMETDDESSNTVQMEKTVSIKGGNGKISYKL